MNSPDWLEDYAFQIDQAHLKLERPQAGADLAEGSQILMHLLQILNLQDLQLAPHHDDVFLVNGYFRGYHLRTILIAERYRVNVLLLFACRGLLVWDQVQQYALIALELAELDETRFSVPWAAKERLRELLEEARLQERIGRGHV